MGVKKAINQNYLTGDNVKHPAVNEANRAFIDRFIALNYERLSNKFSSQRNVVNSSGFGSFDKLNETILMLYTDPEMHFTSWEQANKYLTSKFTDKAIRVVMKKPNRDEPDNE